MPKGIYSRKTADQPKIYVARESFTTMLGDTQISVLKGVTVREGHSLLLGREHLFSPQHVDYEVEQEESESDPEPTPDPEPAPVPVPVPALSVKLKSNKST